VENLRLVMGEIKVADVRAQVSLSMWTDFENFTTFKPHEQHDKAVHLMADEVIAWGGALKGVKGLAENMIRTTCKILRTLQQQGNETQMITELGKTEMQISNDVTRHTQNEKHIQSSSRSAQG